MATNKSTNKPKAPKAPVFKRNRSHNCAGCGVMMTARKSVGIVGLKGRYCERCARVCDLCGKPNLTTNFHVVDDQQLCRDCYVECSICGCQGPGRTTMPLFQGKPVCQEHITLCPSCHGIVLVSSLGVAGVCPNCVCQCVFCRALGAKRGMTYVADRGAYACVKHRLTTCECCGRTYADHDAALPVVRHPNGKDVRACKDCAPRCFLCGQHRHRFYLVYKKCGDHGMQFVCLTHGKENQHDKPSSKVQGRDGHDGAGNTHAGTPVLAAATAETGQAGQAR